MLTVPEAARRTGRNPETIHRWIRSGRLRSQRVGTQHLIAEQDLELAFGDAGEELPLPEAWQRTPDGVAAPNVVRWVRRSRQGR